MFLWAKVAGFGDSMFSVLGFIEINSWLAVMALMNNLAPKCMEYTTYNLPVY